MGASSTENSCSKCHDTRARRASSATRKESQAAKPIALRDQQPVLGSLGQLVRLGVVEVLQPVLEPPQEHVGLGELLVRRRGEQALLREERQHRERRADLQRGIAPAADQLERLGDELDLADAARAELDLIGELAARHLGADLRVELAHRRVTCRSRGTCGRRRDARSQRERRCCRRRSRAP